jgi:predicted dienelactone hydrolase
MLMPRSLASLPLVVGALVGCGSDPSSAPTDAGPDARTSAPDASPACVELDASGGPEPGPGVDLDAPGPHAAGVRTVELTDPTRERTLRVEVWYPAAPGSGAANAYHLDTELGRLASVCTAARRDGDALPGPWPVLVFSHGFGGVRFQSFYLTEHLATHGYVVVAPDHTGNTFADFGALGDDAAVAQSAVDRPEDARFVLDSLLDGSLGELDADPDRVSMSGHSFGGWTSLEAARRDPRFRVVVPLAPGFRDPATPDFVAGLARPILLFGGSVDSTTPFETDQRVPYELASPPKGLVRVLGAGHLDFSDICEIEALSGFLDDGCDPASIEPSVVRARTRVLTLAFLRRYLEADTELDTFLEPAFVVGLGNLEYWREP